MKKFISKKKSAKTRPVRSWNLGIRLEHRRIGSDKKKK